MKTIPSGTVTFLFTDIEGSTRHWEQHPVAMKFALARHNAILREAIVENGGYVFTTVGDAFCAAFETAPQALAAAVAAQKGLHAENWADAGDLRVRMGIHTGQAEETNGAYTGPAVDRLIRLLPAGNGGQILLSSAAVELLRGGLLPGVRLEDMGERRLRDLASREHIFQVFVDGLPGDFPPLRTLEGRPNNLPARPTEIIGREREIVECNRLLRRSDVRLLTLTGPGGIGKTRLALHLAASVLAAFEDGVFVVGLGSITDRRVMVEAISQTLGLREVRGQPLLDVLKDYLRDKHILLLLDNFEQVLSAAPLVWELLSAAPRLEILVTSRSPLHLAAEQQYAVPPLSLPDPAHLPPVERLLEYEAVNLFVTRAQSVRPDFALTEENAPAVVQVCLQLEGVPLAIELAAARIKVLSPQALNARLSSALKLLTGGGRDLPERQQTMRATIQWSYDLLTDAEKVSFRRMAVFVKGATLEAIEAVCFAGGESDAVDSVGSLVDKNLLRQDQRDGEARFRLALTIREFAQERLAESGEEAEMRSRHAEFYYDLAQQAEPQSWGAQQLAWLQLLEREHDNLRAALSWGVGQGQTAFALCLAGSLWRFWYVRSHVSEGRSWLAQALAMPGAGQPGGPRVKALNGAGNLAYIQGDYETAQTCHDEALRIAREIDDRPGVASAINNLALIAQARGDYARARSMYEEALAINRALGHRVFEAINLNNLGGVVQEIGDLPLARSLQEQSLAIFSSLQDEWGTAMALGDLGKVVSDQGDYAKARSLYEESMALQQKLGDRRGIAQLLVLLGFNAWLQASLPEAHGFYEQSLGISKALGDKRGMATSLEGLGNVALYGGDYITAHMRYDEALVIRQEVGYKRGIASAYNNLGLTALREGEHAQARSHLEQSVAVWRELGEKWGLSFALNNLGRALLAQGEVDQAEALFNESTALSEELGNKRVIAYSYSGQGLLAMQRGQYQKARQMFYADACLVAELGAEWDTARALLGLAWAARQTGDLAGGLRLLAMAERMRQHMGVNWEQSLCAEYDTARQAARSALGEERFDRLWQEGWHLTLSAALARARPEPTPEPATDGVP